MGVWSMIVVVLAVAVLNIEAASDSSEVDDFNIGMFDGRWIVVRTKYYLYFDQRGQKWTVFR